MHSPIRLPGPALAAMQPRQGCSVRRGGAADAARKGLALTQPVPELSPCRHSWASAQSVTCCCWSLQAEYEPVTWAVPDHNHRLLRPWSLLVTLVACRVTVRAASNGQPRRLVAQNWKRICGEAGRWRRG